MSQLMFGFIFFAISVLGFGPALASQLTDDYQKASKFYAEKNYDMAAGLYQGILKDNPNYSPALQGLGSCYYQLGQKRKSLDCFEKVLALAPADQRIGAFVQGLRKELGAAGAAPETGLKKASFNDGVKNFQEGKYTAAIPYFKVAVIEDPKNAKAYYDLAYSQFMTGDPQDALVNYTLYDRLESDPAVEKDIAVLRSVLTPAQSQWADVKLGTTTANIVSPMAPGGFNGPFGIRLFPALAFVNIKDFQQDAQTNAANIQLALSYDPTYQYTAEVPSVFFQSEMEPVLELGPEWEVGLPLGYIRVGDYSGSISNAAGDRDSFIYDTTGFSAGLDLRFFMGEGPFKFFLGGGLSLAVLQIHYNETLKYGFYYDNAYGDFSGSAFLPRLQMGMDWHLGRSFVLTPFVSYRMGSAGPFRGNAADTSGYTPTTQGQLDVYQQANGSKVFFFPDNPAAWGINASDYPGLRAFTMDLSGFQAGLSLSQFF